MKKRNGIAYFIFFICVINSCSGNLKKGTSAKSSADSSKVLGNKIRILSYNIKHGATPSGNINLNRIADVINNVEPDIVALQEVDNKTRRSGKINETAKLARLTGLKGYFGKYRDFQGGEYGNAILSKYPLLEFTLVPKNDFIDQRPGSFLFAKVKISEDSSIYFGTSHLSAYSKKQRIIQAKQWVSYWKKMLNKKPLIIAGDFNDNPNSKTLNVLSKYFKATDSTFKPTFSAVSKKKKIDYILFTRTENWKVIKFKRICKEDASDHCAILTVLRFDG
jgi:endonuclease/exonuclease/phosphatase family metal-dependent hydrolase